MSEKQMTKTEELPVNSRLILPVGLEHISKSVDKSIVNVVDAREGNRKVFSTQWNRLNRNLMGGLQPGKMYVIAGRPGVGKSAFSNQLIFDVLDRNHDKNVVVLYWSFEMPGEQQILRAGSKHTKLQTAELLSVDSKLSDESYADYVQSVQKYNRYPIYFCSVPKDVHEIERSVNSVKEQLYEPTIINLIDHSRLVPSTLDIELHKLNELSKTCMYMQAQHNSITILLSQLNRNIEQEFRAKNQYQPMLTDLFGGDSIGQDAHVVMMLQRPYDLYGITDTYCGEDPRGLMAVHVEKNRDGLLGMIPFETDLSTFTINERTDSPKEGG
jgi:replicative DNA helicase